MERQKRDLSYIIGLRCIAILNYVADKLDTLPLSVGRRMISVHDIPSLLSNLLQAKPWLRKTNKGFEKFLDGKWKSITNDSLLKVENYEAQTWFCLRALLFNSNLMTMYEITEYRHSQLAKCEGFLNESILDQLPPLMELKQFLATLQITKNNAISKSSLLLEEIPQIQDDIYKSVEKAGGFSNIAAEQAEKIFLHKRDDIFELARKLNGIYNADIIAEIEANQNKEDKEVSKINKKCLSCGEQAQKKCSNCLSAYYCSRECQVKHWPAHKNNCLSQYASNVN